MEIKTPQGTVCGMIPDALQKTESEVEETSTPVKKTTRRAAAK